MRSRHDKRRRSRISPIDRLIQTQAGSAIMAAVKPSALQKTRRPKQQFDSIQPDSPELHPSEILAVMDPELLPIPKRENIFKRIIHRLQYPVGWRPVIILVLTWALMLGIIWGAFREIMSLGASPIKQSIAQIERKALLEFLGALCLGGVGLSLALTPVLKRPPRGGTVEPLQVDSDK
jgi:hypothetical protein